MTNAELIYALRNNVGVSDYSRVAANLAADRIQELLDQQTSIREDALREAAVVAEALAVKWWKEYKDRLSPHCADPQYQGMSDGADDVAAAILELIGEKTE